MPVVVLVAMCCRCDPAADASERRYGGDDDKRAGREAGAAAAAGAAGGLDARSGARGPFEAERDAAEEEGGGGEQRGGEGLPAAAAERGRRGNEAAAVSFVDEKGGEAGRCARLWRPINGVSVRGGGEGNNLTHLIREQTCCSYLPSLSSAAC